MEFKKAFTNDNYYKTFEKIETYIFPLAQPCDNEPVVVITRQMAKKAGFNLTDEFMIATSASELATNILRYADKGEIIVSIIHGSNGRNGIEILANDKGPGIKDMNLAMQESYSTTKKSLGMGLPSVQKIMDEFEIVSFPGEGTRVIARKWC